MSEISKQGTDQRTLQALTWVADVLGAGPVVLQPVSGDASFRRYFRFEHQGQSIILMDAPPDMEDSAPFVEIAGRLRSAGLRAPEILHFDLASGFGLLQDFGDTLYRELITPDSADTWFPELFDILEGMAQQVDPAGLPDYDADFLRFELDLFTGWYLDRHKVHRLSQAEQKTWNEACERLVESALDQPLVFVHRDFHSCNLLHTDAGAGIIDFQDGMHGPLSYDFISLVWDRYIAWPRDKLEKWMVDMHARLQPACTVQEWIRACDWMGLQRNLKIVGIFTRLHYRDGKPGYLEMIPHFYRYILDVLPLYSEFDALRQLLETPECAP